MKYREQSTTDYPIAFLLVDSADHITGAAGLSPVVTISKDGGVFAPPSGAVSEIGNGWYALAGDADDRDTLGDLLIHAEAAGADPVDDRCYVAPWNIYDVQASAASTDAKLGTPAVDVAADIATRAVPGDNMVATNMVAAAPLAADNATAVWGAGTKALTDKAGFTLHADYDAAKTAASATNLSDLHADVGTAITDIGDVRATDLPAVKTVVDAVKVQTDKLVFTTANKIDARAFTVDDKTAYSLAADQSGVTIGTVNALAAAAVTSIWDKLLTGITAAGSVGKLIKDNLNAAIDSRMATFSYTAPDNAGITAISAKTTNLPASPSAVGSAMTLTIAYDKAKDDVLTPLATVDGIVDAILVDTGTTLDAAIAALPTDADVQAAAAAALTAYDPQTRAEATTDKEAVIAALPSAAPLAADNADAVRTELATELAHLDADVSDAVSAAGTAVATLRDFDPATDTVARVTLVDTATDVTTKAGYSGAATNMVDLSGLDALLDALTLAVAGLPADLDHEMDALAVAVAAVKAKTDTIGSHIVPPIASSGLITVHQGDDYASAEARAITVFVLDAGQVLGLDDPLAVVRLKAAQATWTATSVVSTTDGYMATWEPTSAQTAALTIARQSYEIEAVLAGGHIVTLCTGTLVAVKDIPAVA